MKRALHIIDAPRAQAHDAALWEVRSRRDRAAAAVEGFEALRTRAAAIKARVLSDLPAQLERFESAATARGAVVHWARDAEEHNRIVHGLLASRDITRVVKSKSMLTEECGLNPYLEQRGIDVMDTDLGERIVQLRGEPPSHIVLPAVHLRRADIAHTFQQHLGTAPGDDDPISLTRAARVHLREAFLSAQAGITGVNFALADSGGIVVCTNEGNADLGTVLPPLHIACMGLEKVIGDLHDLAVFTRLLARSATGQAITSYTSHFHGPRPGGELHIVIVDNGRSTTLADPDFAGSLACIRCGACLNTCPVFRRTGGHAYEAVIPGPIGAVLGPGRSPAHDELPFASTLCGSCTAVCPVAIDLHHQLLSWRTRLVAEGRARPPAGMALLAWLMPRPRLYRAALAVARFASRVPGLARVVGALLPARIARLRDGWSAGRAVPSLARTSFHGWYRRHGKGPRS